VHDSLWAGRRIAVTLEGMVNDPVIRPAGYAISVFIDLLYKMPFDEA
jgi:hypothetical protein